MRRAVLIDPYADQLLRTPADPFETIERNVTRRGKRRRGSRSQVDAQDAVAMRHVGNSLVASGGNARRFRRIEPDDAFERRRAGTQHEQLLAS